jgi:hypothetical protein
VSNGFIAATSPKPGSAVTWPSLGTVISRSDMAVSRTLMVSSGIRFSSSMYSNAPVRIASSSGPSSKISGT